MNTEYRNTQVKNAENKNPAVACHNVTVDFPDGTGTVRALDQVSLQVLPGTVTAIVGESGSGKSTLLSSMAGLLQPTEGAVRIAGELMSVGSEEKRSELRRQHIGMIFQQPNLLESLSVAEQLLITDHLRGHTPRRERAEELLAKVGLEGLGSRGVGKLSGGQRQRVNIARAVMNDPDVLLADEPTSALDQELSQEIMQLLQQVSRDLGIATCVVTHDRGMLKYVDEVVEVIDGKIK
ncbi:ABC transporter ATP-binding protein [Corynebacterium pseudodiphtheriticum]|uniref:ABC transporter ATP-binding protein n=1 Tax=Corynebacterium pseudodiphtheriticum TaxID=37637 RepID=UPI0025426DD2|nr:ABC transporter ATP-binding protein [Corynebacterium pseudodiphtheriticum]MDK4240488.1 ABC transporter ATP-binding protein [Corynebacterium pseudodiphtheriticum]